MTGLRGPEYNHAMSRKLESTGERAVTQLNIEREAPAVKHFFETLTLSTGGAAFELNGKHVVIRVTPDKPTEWTPAKNTRRLELIERKITRTITDDERLELEVLQEAMLDHVERVAPIPLDHVRQLYQRIVEKAPANGTA